MCKALRTRIATSILGLSLTLGTLAHPGSALCVGDCHNGGAVGVSDILTLVNIALGTLDVSQCPNGLPPKPPGATETTPYGEQESRCGRMAPGCGQLTSARGLQEGAGGALAVELPGPWAIARRLR